MKQTTILLMLVWAMTIAGCATQDDMEEVNARLDRIEGQLNEISDVKAQLNQIERRLDDIRSINNRLSTTDSKIDGLQRGSVSLYSSILKLEAMLDDIQTCLSGLNDRLGDIHSQQRWLGLAFCGPIWFP